MDKKKANFPGKHTPLIPCFEICLGEFKVKSLCRLHDFSLVAFSHGGCWVPRRCPVGVEGLQGGCDRGEACEGEEAVCRSILTEKDRGDNFCKEGSRDWRTCCRLANMWLDQWVSGQDQRPGMRALGWFVASSALGGWEVEVREQGFETETSGHGLRCDC